MLSIGSQIKKNIFGYIALLVFILFLVFSHLMPLAVYFLFLYLCTDVFTNDLNRLYPVLSKNLLFWIFLILIVAVMSLFIIVIVPRFVKDFPLYFYLIKENTFKFIHIISN